MELAHPELAESSGTASMILDRIPKSEHSDFLDQLIASLKPDDRHAMAFVASLVAGQSKPETTQVFIGFLEEALYHDHVSSVTPICMQHPKIGNALLARIVDAVSATDQHDTPSSISIPVPTLKSLLRFSTSYILHRPQDASHFRLLDGCLDLLQAKDRDLQVAVKDAVLELLAMQEHYPAEGGRESTLKVWAAIKHHLTSTSNPIQPTAYAIWLRWLPTIQKAVLEQSVDKTEYYDLLRRGLRHGDTEQKKLCLNILKRSPTFPEGGRLQLGPPPRMIFDRYITVFDTVVLGRYLNQAIECESDLDAFASTGEIEPAWLYVLLGAALDNRMQEANRKWIANWVMRSGLVPSDDMLEFFRTDFLPWATQGQHFTGTLRSTAGKVVCRHGEQLADFIQRLRKEPEHSAAIVESVVESIMRKQNSMFAHCTVYLLQGLDEALTKEHREDIATIRGLPEVARDCVIMKLSASPSTQEKPITSRRSDREQNALDKMAQFNPTLESLEDIWTDVEYLEFPKKLLLALPASLLSSVALEKAQSDANFAASIREKVHVLQNVAASKTYLFPPLMVAIRRATTTLPSSIDFLDIARIIVSIADSPPEPNIDLLLEESIIKYTPYTYQHYFGEWLSYGIAAYLDLVSRLKPRQRIVKAILDKILSRWRSQKLPPPTVSTWKTTLQLQVLLLCCEQYESTSAVEMKRLLEDLFHILANEPLPNYRYLLEATIVQLITRSRLHEDVIARLQTKDHHANPKHLASLMKIGGILASTSTAGEAFAQQLMTTFVALAASSKVVIRHEAQWQVPILMDHATSQGWTSITENNALIALDEYIRSLARFDDPPLERQVGKYDAETDCTLTNIAEGRWFELDALDSPLTSHADFTKLYTQDPLPPSAPPACIPLGPAILRPSAPILPPDLSPAPAIPQTPAPKTNDIALQTKGSAHLSKPRTPTTRPHPDLIVLASLVANPHNLGGLSRVSEIFGASALTLQNTNVLSNKDFLAVSVSSHLHLPITQLSADGVSAYLREKKREGWTVVGIEQTDRSMVLGEPGTVLPRKCVLVVGSEREGIPGEVLAECGMLVEIKQAGVTRSLNVQTAVACVLFEYGRAYGSGGENAVEEASS